MNHWGDDPATPPAASRPGRESRHKSADCSSTPKPRFFHRSYHVRCRNTRPTSSQYRSRCGTSGSEVRDQVENVRNTESHRRLTHELCPLSSKGNNGAEMSPEAVSRRIPILSETRGSRNMDAVRHHEDQLDRRHRVILVLLVFFSILAPEDASERREGRVQTERCVRRCQK